MKKIFKKISMVLPAGLLVLSFAVPVSAENQAYTFTVDPFTGIYKFDTAQHLDLRSYYGVRGGYNLGKHLGIEAMLGFVPTETNSMAIDNRDVRVFRYGLDLLWNINADNAFVPFFEAGLGGTQTSNPSGGLSDTGHGMVNYGFGAKYFISDTVALRGDIRQSLFSQQSDARTNLEMTVGVHIALGAKKRAVAKIGDTTPPEVTCTSPDSGVTGVAVDRNIRATFDEEMDRSTINDTSSFMVQQGTTPISGKVTFAGTTATFAPSNELEKGTIYTATIVAGVKDAAGNALPHSYSWSFGTVPAPKIVPVVLISLEDSHFDFDSAAVSENGKTILNYNARLLKENPKMKIRIAGYSSASGPAEYNQTLSEKRAASVRNYLIQEGVDKDRLTKVGFGETRPAEYEPVPSDIYSEAAKANQRVLFEVIVK